MTALVPFRTDDELPVVSLAAGGVAAMVRLDGFDRRNRLVWYVLKLAGTHGSVRGRIVGALRNGEQVELGKLDVGPGAIGESRFAVPQPRRDRFAHVYLDLRSDDLALRVEAPTPPIPQRWPSVRPAVALVLAGVVLIGSGALTLFVPRRPLSAAPALVAPTVMPARIASFSARRETSEGSESVLASYLAVAESGALVVVDGKGREVGRAPFSRGGTTRITIARGAERTSLTTRLDVRHGASRATAAIVLTPLSMPIASLPAKAPVAAAMPAADAAPVNAVDPPASVDDAPSNSGYESAAGEPFAISAPAIAGRPMIVLIRRGLPGMRLRLADDAGTAVAEVAVPSGARRVTLTPPAATSAQTYYLTCTYGSGTAEEAVVRSVHVSAR